MHQELERDLHAARVALMLGAVEIVGDGYETDAEQGKHALNEVAGFYRVSPEAGEILDAYAINPALADEFEQVLNARPLKVRAGKSVVWVCQ